MNFLNVRVNLKLLRTRLIKGTSKMAITLPPIIELKTFNVKSTSEISPQPKLLFRKKIEVRGLKPTNSENQQESTNNNQSQRNFPRHIYIFFKITRTGTWNHFFINGLRNLDVRYR